MSRYVAGMVATSTEPGGRTSRKPPADWWAAWILPHIRPRPDGCHQWTGDTYWDGAPKARTPDGPRLAARLIAADSGVRGDTVRTCPTTHCVNPAHHTSATPPQPPKAKPAPKPKAAPKAKPAAERVRAPKGSDRCLKGHPYADNLVPANEREGRRSCATCAQQRREYRTRALGHAAAALGLQKQEYIARFGASGWVALEVLRRHNAGEPVDAVPKDPPRDEAAMAALPPLPRARTTGRTHCPQGHELTDDNVSNHNLKRGVRTCWTCEKARRRESHARRRAKEQL